MKISIKVFAKLFSKSGVFHVEHFFIQIINKKSLNIFTGEKESGII